VISRGEALMQKEGEANWLRFFFVCGLRAQHPDGGRRQEKRASTSGSPSRLYQVGAAGRIRTHDPLVRSQVLYPTELQPQPKGAIIHVICGVSSGESRIATRVMPCRGEIYRSSSLIPLFWSPPRACGACAACRRGVASGRRTNKKGFHSWKPFSSLSGWRGWQDSNPRPLGS
jgi:hypothetical protein